MTPSLRNIEPVVWGPSAWSILHAISFHSKASVETLERLFDSLKILLPCAVCRENYRSHLKALVFPKKSQKVALWVYKLHDRVNQSYGRVSPSFKSIERIWGGKEGVEHAIRDSWRFLFLLALAYPPRGDTHRQFREQYREALGLWVNEIATTLWGIEPRDSSTQSRTRFTQWLKNKYALLNGGTVPSAFMRVPTLTPCEQVCRVK